MLSSAAGAKKIQNMTIACEFATSGMPFAVTKAPKIFRPPSAGGGCFFAKWTDFVTEWTVFPPIGR